MSKVFVFVGLVISAVFIAVFLPIINDQIADVQYNEAVETFTAAGNTTVQEEVTVVETVYSVTSVTVEGVALTTEYSRVGSVFTLDATASDVGDSIVVTYDYEVQALENTVTVLNLVPFIVAIVGVVYFVVKIKK